MAQTGVNTDNWWLIYKSFFLVRGAGKLGISEEWQIQQLMALLRQQ
jgi:hypothetical protein